MPLISLYGRFKGVYKIILQPVAERLDIPPHRWLLWHHIFILTIHIFFDKIQVDKGVI